MNTLRTSVTNARAVASQYVELDEGVANKLCTNAETESEHIITDLTHRIRSGVKTTLENSKEQDVQRWFVTSFCNEGFAQGHHQCADAAMGVFQLAHGRSRELYDLTMLEVRRVLYDDLSPRPPIAPCRLVGTRGAWMVRYAHLLDANEFTKFVVLAKDLSPFVLLLIDPVNHSRRQDRCAAIGRRNLELVLNGHPDAVPLFE
jgi:hypothetical protein